ncbi:hypothetical protein [Nocardia sp. NPDC050406]|uniref:hypothetical protein n=1 Tax=Nocardia sp. NPDC050406 TaxID=3364318 RepID=UPI0037B9A73A
MLTSRNSRPALIAAVLGATCAAVVSAATPAHAANSIDITGVGPANVGVDYSCDASAGVVAVKALVGDPNAESPSASGTQSAVTCDGSSQATVVTLVGANGSNAPLSAGQTVQVRVALVDSGDTVVSGTANVFTLG